MEINVSAVPGKEICDFCSKKEVFADFPAKDLSCTDEDGLTFVSQDPWAACEGCSKLIEAGDYAKLLDRSVAGFYAAYPDTDASRKPALRSFINALHQKFKKNRLPIH